METIDLSDLEQEKLEDTNQQVQQARNSLLQAQSAAQDVWELIQDRYDIEAKQDEIEFDLENGQLVIQTTNSEE